jgi:hypothetical protein
VRSKCVPLGVPAPRCVQRVHISVGADVRMSQLWTMSRQFREPPPSIERPRRDWVFRSGGWLTARPAAWLNFRPAATKEAFYRKLGFKRMSTAMAIFENQALALERGYLNET